MKDRFKILKIEKHEFHLDDENDIRLKEYQDDLENNGDYLQLFIDNENDEILKMLGNFANA